MIAAILLILTALDAPLDDPGQEARAQRLMYEIRCVACQNEPISHSASDLAQDMRRAVREQIRNGATDEQIRRWFAERYGEYVLLRPGQHHGAGRLLWAMPVLLLGGGILALIVLFRAKNS